MIKLSPHFQLVGTDRRAVLSPTARPAVAPYLFIGNWRRRLGIDLSFILLILSISLSANEVIPSKPTKYFNDEAGMVSRATTDLLNETLADFERKTSDQVIVAIYPKMQSDSSIDDYAQRVAQAWGVGRKERNNGVVLFIFRDDREMSIQVGYGLEGVLPDILTHHIIENEIKPNFKAGRFDDGVRAGILAILGAIQGEYRGTGKTVHEENKRSSDGGVPFLIPLLAFLILFLIARRSQSRVYSRRGHYSGGSWSGPWIGTGGGSSWSSGSSGGFSSGGGSFGGGGSSGSW